MYNMNSTRNAWVVLYYTENSLDGHLWPRFAMIFNSNDSKIIHKITSTSEIIRSAWHIFRDHSIFQSLANIAFF